MSMTMVLLRAGAAAGGGPARVMTMVNDRLAHGNRSHMFVTLFLGVLDLRDGVFTFVNAGHNQPYLLRRGGAVVLEESGGPMAGGFEGFIFEESSVRLQPGEGLFLYTDGVTEAMNAERRQFGEEGLEKILADAAGNSPDDMLQAVETAVRRHENGVEASDDVTMLCCFYQGAQ